MQGVYRVQLGSRDLLETFVAAPGPMGWRYFARLREPDAGREVSVVDLVVDMRWDLVRFRWMETNGSEVIAMPTDGGLEVLMNESGGERRELFTGASVVWSGSPSSLIVIDRLLASSKGGEARAVRLVPPFDPRPVVVRVTATGSPGGSTRSGSYSAREVEVTVDGERTRALFREDMPLEADGWFQLVE